LPLYMINAANAVSQLLPGYLKGNEITSSEHTIFAPCSPV
jgi:hypothetical protein